MASVNQKTWVEIDQAAIAHNVQQFKNIIEPEVKLLVAVKANAYGHGLVEVSKIALAAGADWLGVDSIDEALALRQAGVNDPILIVGYVLRSRLSEAVENGFRLIVYNRETIEELGKITSFDPSTRLRANSAQDRNSKGKINIHLKIETGISRQGVMPEDAPKFVKLIKKFPHLNIEGISTHFANIEDTTDYSYAQKQLKTFQEVVSSLEKEGVNIPLKHTANSAATMLFPETHFDIARVGISLYGFWPSPEAQQTVGEKKKEGGVLKDFSLQTVLTWKTIVAQVKDVKVGTAVGYGCTERVERDSRIAVLPIGYWDGYDRKLSRVGEVLIKGQRCKVLGRVFMNMTVVDVTDCEEVTVEDEVVLLGRQGSAEITADSLADRIGTINYEFVTRINPLIKRVVV
ncbi:MAG: alanine racemase [Parcubacteria group bacterium]|nr:alanine racemase [Parcubacteria group bacterium]